MDIGVNKGTKKGVAPFGLYYFRSNTPLQIVGLDDDDQVYKVYGVSTPGVIQRVFINTPQVRVVPADQKIEWTFSQCRFDPAYSMHVQELVDSTPHESTLGTIRPLTLREQIQQCLREEASRIAHEGGYETFEEADDFDMDDETPLTAYEEVLMQDELTPGLDQERPTEATKKPQKGKSKTKSSERDESGALANGEETRGSAPVDQET